MGARDQLHCLFEDARCTLAVEGENETWKVELPDRTLAVRRYRPGRRTLTEIEAEWAWVEDLDVPAPAAIEVSGQRVFELAGRHAVAMPWLSGEPLSYSDPDDVTLLGELCGRLRHAASTIDRPDDWIGWQRPTVDAAGDLERDLRTATEPDYATPERSERLRRAIDRLAELLEATPLTETGWVHADLHAWNVLNGPDGAFVIDFDDCVFGPPDLEWATARIHLRGKGDLERDWPRFLEGVRRWCPEPAPDRVRVATASHLVATIAEFPIHLDMPALADAGAVFDRYCGYLEAELQPEGSR